MALVPQSQLARPDEYTSQQVADFWNSTNDETKNSICAKATPSDSLDTYLQRIRKRPLASRRPFFSLSCCGTAPIGPDISTLSIKDFDALDALMEEHIRKAESQAEAHHLDQQVVKKVGRATSEFLVGFRDYCQAYSGVIQLMAGVSQGYSTTALEILTLFMVVAVNKSETEQELDAMIQTLKGEYARIRRLTDVYSGIEMKECIATVYRLGIEFLQEATIYYSYKSGRRLWHVFSRPPGIDLKAKVSAIEGAINELNLERNLLNGIRLNSVEDGMQSQLKYTSNELAVSRLNEIKSLLDLPYVNPSHEFTNLASLLDGAFYRRKRIPPFEPEDLFSKAEYCAWKEATPSKSSSFLLVHGRTTAPYNTSLSWASQASVEIVRGLQAENAILAWYLCKPDDEDRDFTRAGDPAPTAALTLLSLGYRLLELTPAGRAALGSLAPEAAAHFETLRDSANTTREALAAYKAEKRVMLMDCSRAAMEFLRGSIATVALHGLASSSCPDQLTVHLVVDRFDVLPLRDTALLKPLMGLVQNPVAGVAVKILVVGERKMRDQKGGDEVAEFVEDYKGKMGWGVVEMDQGL